MRRLKLNTSPAWLAYDDALSLEVRPLSLPDLFEIAEGTKLQAALERPGEEDDDLDIAFGPREAAELGLRIVETAVIAWTVADADDAPLPVSREVARWLFTEEPGLIETLIARVLTPAIESLAGLEQEKNASAPSPNGITAGAPTTAPHAPRHARRAPTD